MKCIQPIDWQCLAREALRLLLSGAGTALIAGGRLAQRSGEQLKAWSARIPSGAPKARSGAAVNAAH